MAQTDGQVGGWRPRGLHEAMKLGIAAETRFLFPRPGSSISVVLRVQTSSIHRTGSLLAMRILCPPSPRPTSPAGDLDRLRGETTALMGVGRWLLAQHPGCLAPGKALGVGPGCPALFPSPSRGSGGSNTDWSFSPLLSVQLIKLESWKCL